MRGGDPESTLWSTSTWAWESILQNTRERENPVPSRGLNLPIYILQTLESIALHISTWKQYIINITCITIFFLIRRGEYCQGGADTLSTPFRLWYVLLFLVNIFQYSQYYQNNTYRASNLLILLFMIHNNGVKGDSICHNCTGHPW